MSLLRYKNERDVSVRENEVATKWFFRGGDMTGDTYKSIDPCVQPLSPAAVPRT